MLTADYISVAHHSIICAVWLDADQITKVGKHEYMQLLTFISLCCAENLIGPPWQEMTDYEREIKSRWVQVAVFWCVYY